MAKSIKRSERRAGAPCLYDNVGRDYNSRMKIIGIDMTQSDRPCSLVAINENREMLRPFETDDDDAIVNYCAGADLVDIDSPLFLPQGLCCLEEDCTCQPVSEKKGRECERLLSKRHIPSYYTTKKSIIKKMVYRSMKISKRISENGVEVIEIYPHASSGCLFGDLPKKTSPRGLTSLVDKLRGLVEGVEQIKNHDQADALLGAYSGWLRLHGRAEAIGDKDEGFLWIPRHPAAREMTS